MSQAPDPEGDRRASAVMPRVLTLVLALAVTPSSGAAMPFFTRIVGDPASTEAVRLFGGGWADRNGDGYLDIYTSGDGNQFYENDGTGTFVPVTGEDFVIRTGADHFYPMGIWADWNGDGYQDLYRATFGRLDTNLNYLGPAPDILYRNAGPPTYELVREASPGDTTSTSSMAWVDYDRDGDLDLSTTSTNGTPDLFYRNDGPGGFVSLVDLPFLGVGTVNSNIHAWIDIDDDGDEDLYTVNHREPNELWMSQLVESGDPDAFIEDTASLLVQDGNEFDIAADWGDYDNDGDFDVFIAVTGGPRDRLFRNEGGGAFVEMLTPPGNVIGNSSFGTWGDLDNDGDEDLFVGRIAFQQANPIVYRNDGDGVFVTPFAAEYGQILGSLPSPQAGEWGDYDLDGDLDLYVITFARPNNSSGAPQPNYLYRNEGGTGNRWLMVECVGTESNRSAIGARVRVRAIIDGQPRWQSRIVWGSMSGNSSQSDLRVHFGLGDAEVVDSVRVEWPSGIVSTRTAVAVDQLLTLVELGTVAVGATPGASALEIVAVRNPFSPSATLRFELRTTSDVRLDVFDPRGRHVRRLTGGTRNAGEHTVSWDGNDAAGRAVAAGLYLVVLGTPEGRVTRKLTLER